MAYVGEQKQVVGQAGHKVDGEPGSQVVPRHFPGAHHDLLRADDAQAVLDLVALLLHITRPKVHGDVGEEDDVHEELDGEPAAGDADDEAELEGEGDLWRTRGGVLVKGRLFYSSLFIRACESFAEPGGKYEAEMGPTFVAKPRCQQLQDKQSL